MKEQVKIIECPRDAMQGITPFIPTATKIAYLNQLLKVGFDTLDFGSFVSPKAIPQLKDTTEVLAGLDLDTSKSKLLAIVANKRGVEDTLAFSEISYLGFPYSLSETFQQRNTNKSKEEAFKLIEEVHNIIVKSGKKLVLYFSMGFGNPYGDPFHEDLIAEELLRFQDLDIDIFALSDTIGVAKPALIAKVFVELIKEFPKLELGAHFHTTPDTWKEKIESAYAAGCKRFDGAIKGFGGCPMAKDELTGNMPTELMIDYFEDQNIDLGINRENFDASIMMAGNVFPN